MQSIAPSPDVPRLTWGGDLGGWSGSDGEGDDEDEEPRAPPITLEPRRMLMIVMNLPA